MTRRAFVAGNWKMHKTAAEARAFVRDFLARLPDAPAADVAIFPPFTALAAVVDALGDAVARSPGRVEVGAQDFHFEERGAFTGEISAEMIRETGARYVLVGHSERRALFGETDASCAKKVGAAVRAGLLPILCAGETLAEHDAGSTFARVGSQIEAVFSTLERDDARHVTVAYEPVWAIGTGRNATPFEAQEVHAFARETLRKFLGEAADATRILYGGSVAPANARELLAQSDVDGALVGGASLEARSFADIVKNSI